MGFDQTAVTEAISQGEAHASAAPEGVNMESKPPQSSGDFNGSIGNTSALRVGGTLNGATTTLPRIGSAFRASISVEAVNSPANFISQGATSLGMQGRVVPLSAASPGGSVRYAKVLSVSPKQAQESFNLAPRTVSMESTTISRPNTLASVQELPPNPFNEIRMAPNLSQSSMEEIRLMMHELRRDFTALQSRVNALPAGNGGGTPPGVLEAVAAEKKERRREMGELAAYVNTALVEIRAQAAVFSDHLNTAGETPAIVQSIEEPGRLEGLVKNLLAQDLVRERDAREKGDAELAKSLEEVTARAVEHCNSLEQRVASHLLSAAPAQNQGADDELLRRLAAVEALCDEGQRELEASLVDLQAKVAEHREHTREVETGLVQGLAEDIAALKEQGASIDALHGEVEVLQASAIDTAELLLEAQQEARKAQQSSRSDVEAAHRYHAHLVESHKAQVSNLEAAHGNHVNTVESHKTQLGQLEAAQTSHANIADTHGSKLSSLDAAHGHHATMFESHGNQLRSLTDAHSDHTRVMESHKAQLSDLEAARSSHASIVESQGAKLSSIEASHGEQLSELATAHQLHLSAVEMHRDQLMHLEAAHGEATSQLSSLKDAHSHHINLMESHKAQLSELEVARLSNAGIAESQGTKLSSLEAAHGHHGTIFESHGNQLSSLTDEHRHHTSMMESHKAQLSDLEAARLSHAGIAESQGTKLSSLEAAHGHHATMVESHAAQLSELATAHQLHLSVVETHKDQLMHLESANDQAIALVESHVNQLSSLKDTHSHHANLMESHKMQLSELEVARLSHAHIAESHDSKLSSLEAAHGHHATISESHGNQLSSLSDAHRHHTSVMESHKVQLSDLEVARSSHASIVQTQGAKLSNLEAAHDHHATMVESHGAQLSELAMARQLHLSAVETHRDQLLHFEAAHSQATSQLSSLKDAHSHHINLMESQKHHISELQATQGHHASTLDSLQHQVNSVRDLEQLVSRLSADMDVIRRQQQDGNRSPHESHEFAGRLEEQTALTNELRSKINALEVSSAESAELHKSWKASCQEPAGSNPKVVGRLEDHSVMVATLKNDLQVLQGKKTDYKEVAAAECASNKMEAAATKIQSSARGRMARKQVAERKEEADASERVKVEMEAAAAKIQCSARGLMARKLAALRMEEVGAVQRANNEREAAATKIQCSARGRLARQQVAERKEAMVALVTRELHVSGVEPAITRQETGLSSSMSERQVTGSDKQSVTGTPQAQRSWWRRLTSGGSSQTPISPHATPLQFTILGAKGLKVADWTCGEGKSDPFCICELKGKSKASKTQTQVIYHDLDPIWNHQATFNDYVVGDSLVFKIYDVDYTYLGSLVLPSEKFHPHGFEGELPLESAGEDSKAVLRLKIEAPLESTSELPVTVAVADASVATIEHQVTGSGSMVECQDTEFESAITERQVSGSKESQPRSLWDRLTSRVSSQPAASEATPLRITIVSAKGLRIADWTSGEGKSDPYCICELKGKSRASKVQTEVVEHSLDPEWNHEGVLNDYTVGDSLVFKIYDSDYIFLGSLVLPSEKFHPHGFEGELPLEDAGEDGTAALRLKIEPPVNMKDDAVFEAAGEDWKAEY